MYMLTWSPAGPQGRDWLWIVLGLFLDVAHWADVFNKRKQIPVSKDFRVEVLRARRPQADCRPRSRRRMKRLTTATQAGSTSTTQSQNATASSSAMPSR